MPVTCPVCETPNPEDAAECAQCGKVLAVDADLLEDVAPLPGLEQTLQDRVDADGEAIPGLEPTLVADPHLEAPDQPIPGVERTQLEEDPEAPVNWMGGAPIDLGRELDSGERTPAPQDTGTCPWCGSPATGAVCDNCGRRRSRYSAPPAAAQAQAVAGDDVMCPACFARVAPGPRCVECGVPFPVAEL